MKDFFRKGIAQVILDVSLDCVDPDTQLTCAMLLEYFPKESGYFLTLLKMVIGLDLTAPDFVPDIPDIKDALEEAKRDYWIMSGREKEATT